jgi:hypothetical protein
MATLAGPPGPWRFPVACCPAETADRSPSTCGQYLQSLNPGFNKMQPRNHILLPGFWCTYKYKYKDPRYPSPPPALELSPLCQRKSKASRSAPRQRTTTLHLAPSQLFLWPCSLHLHVSSLQAPSESRRFLASTLWSGVLVPYCFSILNLPAHPQERVIFSDGVSGVS